MKINIDKANQNTDRLNCETRLKQSFAQRLKSSKYRFFKINKLKCVFRVLTTAITCVLTLSFGLASAQTKISSPTKNDKTTKTSLKKVTTSKATPKKNEPIIVTPERSHIKIKLKENTGSTGYQWFLEYYNHNLLELYKYEYVKPAKMMPGAAGEAVFDFLIKNDFKDAPQITSIKFAIARTWDLSSKVVKEYNVVSVGR